VSHNENALNSKDFGRVEPDGSKGVNYGSISAIRRGNKIDVETSDVSGVGTDLRVRPFFAHGGTISIREFIVGAWNAEMGLQAVHAELAAAHNGGRFITRSGMVLGGATDQIEAPPAIATVLQSRRGK
jgi:hypothetical protein